MKNKKTVLVIIIITFTLILAGLLIWLLWPKKSSREIYIDAIKESLGITALEEAKDEDYFKDKMMKFSLDGYMSVGEEKTSEKLDFYYGKDQLYFLFTEGMGEEPITLEALMKDKKIYFTIRDVLSKFYYADLNELTQGVNIEGETETISKVMDLFEKAAFDAIDSEKLNVEDAKVTINGVEYKAKKYSYEYTGVDLYKILENFTKELKNDKKLYKELSDKLAGLANGELTLDDMIDLFLTELKPLSDSSNKLFTHTMYMRGSETIQTSLSVVLTEQPMPIIVELVSSKVENKGLEYKEVSMHLSGQKLLYGKIEEVSEGNSNISIGFMGQEIVKGYLKETDESVKLRLETTEMFSSILSGQFFESFDDSSSYVPDIDVTVDVDLKKNDNGVKGTIKAKFSVDDEAMELNYNIEAAEVSEMPKVDVSNSAPYDQMTESDKAIFDGMPSSYDIEYPNLEDFSEIYEY